MNGSLRQPTLPIGRINPVRAAWAVIVLIAFAAHARQVAPDSAFPSAVARLPTGLQAVVVVRDAAGQRASPAGLAVTAALRQARAFDRTIEAWGQLSAVLGWTPSAAFDRLLGEQLIIAVAEGEGRQRRWAVLSDVAADVAEHLRRRLSLHPRQVWRNATILAGEDGKFCMALVPSESDRRTLILASSANRSLFDDIVDSLGSSAPVLGDSAGFRASRDLPVSDVVLLLNWRSDERRERTFVAISARHWNHGWSGWEADVRASWNGPVIGPSGTRIDYERFEELGREWGALVLGSGVGELDRLVSMLRVADSGASAGPIREQADGRWILGVRPSGNGRLASIGAGVEAGDVRAIAPACDAYLSRLGAALRLGPSAATAEPIRIDESRIGATRVMPIASEHVAPWESLLGDAPVLAWAYVTSDDAPGGWWTTCLAPDAESADAVGRDLRSLFVPSDGSCSRPEPVAAGTVRPGVLLDAIAGTDPTGVLLPLRAISSISWSLAPEPSAWEGAPGMVRGRLRVVIQPLTAEH